MERERQQKKFLQHKVQELDQFCTEMRQRYHSMILANQYYQKKILKYEEVFGKLSEQQIQDHSHNQNQNQNYNCNSNRTVNVPISSFSPPQFPILDPNQNIQNSIPFPVNNFNQVILPIPKPKPQPRPLPHPKNNANAWPGFRY